MGDDRVLVVIGSTAAGKTAVATAIACLAPVGIVSADSRQVYRGLNIGTAKPTPADRAAAPYYGLDLVEPFERYSAGRFARDATAWIAAIRGAGREPVVLGGTGLYLRALFEGLFVEPPLDPSRREALLRALNRMESGELERWARRLDHGFPGGGRHRSARAVEVALLAGRPLSLLQAATAPAPRRLRPWYVLLTLPRAILARRIAARVEAMLASGLVDEVRRVLESGVAPDAPGLSGVGYREVVRSLSGRAPLEGLGEAITISTRRYAKRQETWFRHQLGEPVQAFDATREPEALARDILSGYRAASCQPE